MDEMPGTLASVGRISGTLSSVDSLSGSLTSARNLSGSLASLNPWNEYTGVTEVIPTTSTQTLNTAGLVVRQNIVVNPIPSNYGLITWNGAVLTVS